MQGSDWTQKVLNALRRIENHPLGGKVEVNLDPAEKPGTMRLSIFTWLRQQTIREFVEIDDID